MYSVGRTRQAASLLVAISAFLSSTIRCPTVRITSQHFIGRRGQTPSFLVYINAFVSSTIRSPTVIITGQHFVVGYSIYSACRWASDIGIRRNVSKAANSRLAEEESSGYGVSIKFNTAFLKGLAWDILVFEAWWICCYELELTTEITSFQLGWIILTSTIWRVLFVPVDPAEKENKNGYYNFDLSVDLRIRFISVKTVWLGLLDTLPNRAACWCLITLGKRRSGCDYKRQRMVGEETRHFHLVRSPSGSCSMALPLYPISLSLSLSLSLLWCEWKCHELDPEGALEQVTPT
ncbi:hypothetical protein FEM48_Zijuj04G0196400 [Ziziphus jujuba var. spinosa]|uniref:Uncharacterized protein n=1 Tax=Ziziphus jujuba var. spinosa TaxID=714518 RepID=A0A978VLT1_ZIZJJ|nr:hypothetical protein FEM48_Zijuj04G0196400 [Ziziphus jujuba var. spinosa]